VCACAVALDLLLTIGAYKSLTVGMLTAKLARFTLSLAWGGALSFFCMSVPVPMHWHRTPSRTCMLDTLGAMRVQCACNMHACGP